MKGENIMLDYVCVSVIIPVYNVENYLERCIRSVVSQSHRDLDIVLVDDGSTDKSTEICRKWERNDNRITYIRQDNAGLGAARNSGMNAVKSDYITFLDSDDWLEPVYVEKIIGAMIADDSDVGQCDIHYIDSVSGECQLVKLRYGGKVVSCREDKSIVNKSRLFAWGKIFKRSLLEKCGFSFPSIAFEDTCIPALIASANQVSYVPEPLINYLRNRPGSLSNYDVKTGDIVIGLQLLYEKLNELGLYPEFVNEYKKIVLGQLRFACRKWSGVNNGIVVGALRELGMFVGDKFPELKNVMKVQYFAFGDQLLNTALDYAIPQKEQISPDITGADCVVAFEQDIPEIPKNNARIIGIPDYGTNQNDTVSAAFDIAELIMERL